MQVTASLYVGFAKKKKKIKLFTQPKICRYFLYALNFFSRSGDNDFLYFKECQVKPYKNSPASVYILEKV